MFTGLVEELGRVKAARGGAGGLQLVIGARMAGQARVGESISVNGVCLTVTGRGDGFFTAEVMPETVRRTTLGSLRAGDPVNLERSLQVGGRLGGHLVTGHIDGVGTVTSREREGSSVVLVIRGPEEVHRYLVPKGSVAVDGVSLTVAALTGDGFLVSLIPHTAGVTTLGGKSPGDRVNLEADLIGKYVERLLGAYRQGEEYRVEARPLTGDGKPAAGSEEFSGNRAGGLTAEFLREHGFGDQG